MTNETRWFWCSTHRQSHNNDENGQRGCTLAVPFRSELEAVAFGRRTDPEAFDTS